LPNQLHGGIVVLMPNPIINLNFSPAIRQILLRLKDWLASRNIPAYIVGGMVRDLLLGRSTADIDITVASDVLALSGDLAAALSAKAVVLDEANRIVRLVPYHAEEAGQWHVDLSTIEKNLDTDLARRDFRLNAMAIDLGTLALEGGNSVPVSIIDPLGGMDDIKKKYIHAVNAGVFAIDGIRLLRVMRLSAELGFAIDADTESLIRRDRDFITDMAGERIREELLRLLRPGGTHETLRYMQELGLLTTIIPELEPSIGLMQPKEHAWDVFNHSLKSIEALDFLLRRGGWPYTDASVLQDVPWNTELERYFASSVSAFSTRHELIKMAALLHDIAKPQTKTITSSGRTRFFGHPQLGAPVALAIMQRLRFSVKETRLVETVVREHLRPVQMGKETVPTTRAVYRYFRDVGDAALDTLFFSLADHLAARGPELDLTNWRWHANIVAYMLAESAAEKKVVKPDKLIDGDDLQQNCGLFPGPEIGRLLESVREAQAAGEVITRKEALSYIKKLIGQGKSNETL
jgi:poly(A) polymerase